MILNIDNKYNLTIFTNAWYDLYELRKVTLNDFAEVYNFEVNGNIIRFKTEEDYNYFMMKWG